MIGDFEVTDEDLAGRIGKLETAHGKLMTPAFFPVVNPFKKELTVEEVQRVGFNNIITNSYFLMKRGVKRPIHEFLNFNGVIMTDSGAYQILQYGDIDAENEQVVKYELEVSTDIGVFLDLPTGDSHDRENALRSVEETLRRGQAITETIRDSRTLWVHPIQGGTFLDLVSKSAAVADSREEFKMLALGSPTPLMEGYQYRELVRMIFAAKSSVGRGKPFHLFGGGIPHLIPIAVALGVDSFDSASYVLYAREGRYMTRERVLRIEQMRELPCSCRVCSTHTSKELLESEERSRLLALHNLHKIKEELVDTRNAIVEGRLFEYVQQKAMSHPSLYGAFREFRKFSEYLEKYDPRTKGEPRGIFLFNEDSLHRPEILRHKRKMMEWKSINNEMELICYDLLPKPYLREAKGRENSFVLAPYFGVVPINVSEVYPLSQFEDPKDLDVGVIEDLRKSLLQFIEKNKVSRIRLKCQGSMLKELLHIDSIPALELS